MAARDFNEEAQPKRARPVDQHEREVVKLFSKLAYRHDKWKVFADFCELAAVSLSNAVDKTQYEKREARYMQIVKGYDRAEVEVFPLIFAEVVMALERQGGDVLGRVFHELELHNKWAGQYFSPDSICEMMAMMTVGDADDLKDRIAKRGFVTAQEPAVGSGAMVIALAKAMRAAGINYQEHLHVTAIDVDPKCVHMAYIQFTLLHIPAVIVHGNTLAMQEYEHWFTPAHIMGGWQWKLRRQAGIEQAYELITMPPPEASAPISVATETARDEAPEAKPEPIKMPGLQSQLTLF